jgi:colanic acid/amylovoran/stewartan biosynthesis glycosyltransferase WcaL/AmsK/CpsK
MEPPLRIAFFLGTFPAISETFILRQITGLLDLGHHVEIYADNPAPEGTPVQPEVEKYKLLNRATFMDMPAESAPWELPVLPLGEQSWVPGAARPVRNVIRAARAIPVFLYALTGAPRLTIQTLRRSEYGFQATSLSVLYRLYRLLHRPARYDILHAHFGPNANSFRFARELWGAPLMVSFHGYDFSTIPRKQGTDVYRKLFQAADLITVNSAFTRGQVERLGCPPHKLRLLPVGLNPGDFNFRERTLRPGEALRLITVGRLVPIKGHEFALRAVAALRQAVPAVRFDIVGGGPLRASLGNLARELGLQDVVHFHGALPMTGIQPLLDAAHIFLLTSVNVEGDQEGQGLALQEAQAAGLPVIATRHGALPEGLAPDQSGFVVPEGDVAALAERLSYLVTHPEIWGTLGRNGRDFVRTRYDISSLNRQLVELYKEMHATCERAKFSRT